VNSGIGMPKSEHTGKNKGKTDREMPIVRPKMVKY